MRAVQMISFHWKEHIGIAKKENPAGHGSHGHIRNLG